MIFIIRKEEKKFTVELAAEEKYNKILLFRWSSSDFTAKIRVFYLGKYIDKTIGKLMGIKRWY